MASLDISPVIDPSIPIMDHDIAAPPPADLLDDDMLDGDDDDLASSASASWNPSYHHSHHAITHFAAHHSLPAAMPDLRFEQSYLRSIAGVQKYDQPWKNYLAVALVTVRDQMVMPMVQGVLYNLAVAGWQNWNRKAQFGGQSTGARLRRWWWGVNHWVIPRK